MTIVERDTQETLVIHYLRCCYLCFTLVTVLSNELMIFPAIAFYGNYCMIQYGINKHLMALLAQYAITEPPILWYYTAVICMTCLQHECNSPVWYVARQHAPGPLCTRKGLFAYAFVKDTTSGMWQNTVKPISQFCQVLKYKFLQINFHGQASSYALHLL